MTKISELSKKIEKLNRRLDLEEKSEECDIGAVINITYDLLALYKELEKIMDEEERGFNEKHTNS